MSHIRPAAPFAAFALAAAVLSPAHADPVQIFGGEFAITDGIAGLNIDVNADGIFDLNFAYYGVSVNSIFAWDGVVNNASAAADIRFGGSFDENGRSVHTRFAPDAEIGPAIDSGVDFGVIAYEEFFEKSFGGNWTDQESGFLGFSFLDDTAGRHYGWAELKMDNSDDTGFGSMILIRIAYETAVDTPIAAGDTGADPACNAADLAPPTGLLDLADITAFVAAFVAMDPLADIDTNGVFDLTDITDFVTAFNNGCP